MDITQLDFLITELQRSMPKYGSSPSQETYPGAEKGPNYEALSKCTCICPENLSCFDSMTDPVLQTSRRSSWTAMSVGPLAFKTCPATNFKFMVRYPLFLNVAVGV